MKGFLPRTLVLTMLCACASKTSPEASRNVASIDDIPVIGAVLNGGTLLVDGIFGTTKKAVSLTKNVALFTVGNVTLNSYILTLPLEAGVKARVIGRIANPVYATKLSSFLMAIKEQYTGENFVKDFNSYIKTKYTNASYKGLEHGLFTFKPEPKEVEGAEKKSLFDRKMIAKMVTFYDAIYGEEENSNILEDKTMEPYQYLTKSENDLKVVARVQSLVVDLIQDLAKGVAHMSDSGMVKSILEDAKPGNAKKVNNKAQAVTISLVDFVRMLVHKNYNAHVMKEKRIDSLYAWMEDKLSNDPHDLIGFLKYLNQDRKFAVQIVVDGLQGHMLEGLTSPSKNKFISQVMEEQFNLENYAPKSVETSRVRPPFGKKYNYDFLSNIKSGKLENDFAYLPYFKKMFKNHRNTIAKNGVSTTPTISVRNLPLAKTGAPVSGLGGTQLPNFHYVERNIDRAYYFFGNDAVLLDKITREGKMKTMFERLANYRTLNCNAQYDIGAGKSYDALINLAAGEKARDFGERLCANELFNRAKVELELKEERADLMEKIFEYSEIPKWQALTKPSKKKVIEGKLKELARKEESAMPEYVLIYNPWPDHFAHGYGQFSDETISATGELNRLDYWLGQYEAAYAKAGVLDRTLFAMAGDHGLSQAEFLLNPEIEVLDKLNTEEDLELSILKISSDEGEGPKITNSLYPPTNKGIDIVIASTAGGNYMMDFFKDQKAGWKKQPLYKDLTELTVIKSQKQVDMIEETARRLGDTLDYLAVRETDCTMSKCSTRIVAYRNGERRDEIIARVEDRIAYYNVSEKDNDPLAVTLLELDKVSPYRAALTENETTEFETFHDKCVKGIDIKNSKTWCTDKQWRQYTRFTPKPDSVAQLSRLYHSELAGTVNLFPRFAVGYNTKVPGRHAGEHFHEKDAFVGFWGKPISSKSTRLSTALNGSIAPTIYEYLTGKGAKEGSDSWGFDSVFNQIKQ
jgi:hypothetical protein